MEPGAIPESVILYALSGGMCGGLHRLQNLQRVNGRESQLGTLCEKPTVKSMQYQATLSQGMTMTGWWRRHSRSLKPQPLSLQAKILGAGGLVPSLPSGGSSSLRESSSGLQKEDG